MDRESGRDVCGVGDCADGRPRLRVVADAAGADTGAARPAAGGADGEASDLGIRIVALAGRLSAATCRWLVLVARFDAVDGAAGYGLASTARWLEYACGSSRRTALEQVRMARALAAHPCLVDAMTAGRLSYSQVRSISRVADVEGGALVQHLVEVAEHWTVAQLEAMVRGLRTVRDLDGPKDTVPGEVLNHGWTEGQSVAALGAARSRARRTGHLGVDGHRRARGDRVGCRVGAAGRDRSGRARRRRRSTRVTR